MSSSLSTICDEIIWTPAQPLDCEGATSFYLPNSFLLSNQRLSNFKVAQRKVEKFENNEIA